MGCIPTSGHTTPCRMTRVTSQGVVSPEGPCPSATLVTSIRTPCRVSGAPSNLFDKRGALCQTVSPFSGGGAGVPSRAPRSRAALSFAGCAPAPPARGPVRTFWGDWGVTVRSQVVSAPMFQVAGISQVDRHTAWCVVIGDAKPDGISVRGAVNTLPIVALGE